MYRDSRKILLALGMAATIWFILDLQLPIIVHMLSLNVSHPLSTAFMRRKALIDPLAGYKYRWVNSGEISRSLKNAVVTSEDDRFFEHSGVDINAIEKAAEKNWKRKKLAAGGSTITQQLVKNLYLSPNKSILRKGREFMLALALDALLPKDRILELYLNVAQFGRGIYGAEAASQFYFKQPAKSLSPAQAAFLASILPAPERYGRRGFRMSHRAKSILSRM